MQHLTRVAVLAGIIPLCFAACAPALWDRWRPKLDVPATVVRVEPRESWSDTGVIVQAGELLFLTAIGEVTFVSHGDHRVGPDGDKPWVGVKVGKGGLVARIGPSGEPFDVGARSQPFKYPNIHSHRYHPPPPLVMPAAGRLFLGFKDFAPGNNQGAFEVSIRPAEPRPDRQTP